VTEFKESEADWRCACRCGKLVLCFDKQRRVMHQWPECSFFAEFLRATAIVTTESLEFVELDQSNPKIPESQ
jgi:hypothetical protein